METENKIGSPHEELEMLKRRIAELEPVVSGDGAKQEAAAKAIKEHIAKKPEEALKEGYRLPEKEIEERAERISPADEEEKEHRQKVTELIQLARDKGILNAVSVVKKLGDPHLEDDFHGSVIRYVLGAEKEPVKAKKPLKLALNLVLYEISLPRQSQKELDKNFKELIAVMEQFYGGMSALDSYFVLELGLPFSGEEVVFYAAIPKDKSQLFEKQVHGLFPEARVIEKKEDYNVFKPEGFSLGSALKLGKNAVLPIKTYDKFEADPLQVIINTFSKLRKEGEGAAIQLVVSPKGNSFSEKVKATARKMREGKPFSEAAKSKSLPAEILEAVWGLIFGSPAKKEENPKPIDEETIKLLEEKSSRPIMMSNIRLLVSAESEEKAKTILSELESSFLQFEQPQGNKFYFDRPRKGKLKDLFYKFSFRIPDKKNMIPLNTAELTTVFHFPAGISAVSAPQLKYAKTKEAAPPLNLPDSGLLLGENHYRGEKKPVFMKDDDRRRHFYIIGQTGTGKSILLKNMILQDIKDGKGLCFIDPHGSDLEDILARIPEERAKDVIYFNPGDTARPMGLNMLEYDRRYPEQKTFVVNELFSIFQKLYGSVPESMGPMFEQYFRNATMLVIEDPDSGNTLLDVSRVLADADFREMKLSRCKNPIVTQFWVDVATKAGGESALANIVPYITSKFDVFLANEIMRPIIGQEKSAFNFREVMDEGRILMVNLSKGRLGDLNANLLGLVIVGKLLMASLSRVDVPEEQRKDFYLYMDEFQNVSTDSISTILSEARKYRLDLIIAHQFIAQLEENIKKSVFGNVGSMASFRVGSEDAEFLEKQFEPVFSAYDLMNVDNYNAYLKLLVDGQVSRPFNVKTFPFEKGDPAAKEAIARLSAEKYGRPREEVEEEISKKYV